MATTTPRFAAKTNSIAPLTAQADSFSSDTFAHPDFASGRIIVANYEFPDGQRFEGFAPSYRSGQPRQQQQEQQGPGQQSQE